MSYTKTNDKRLESIHASFDNGQNKDAIEAINEYGLYDFWADYKEYLEQTFTSASAWYAHYTNATIVYSRITNR